jgi:tetratricopeptide (TPR) repeat protein
MVKAYPQHQLRPRAEVRAGQCCLALEKWPEAVRWFTTARARPKLDKVDLPVVDHGLGVGYQMTGRHDSAIQAFQRVAGQYEGARAAECQFRIAQCRVALGDTSGAVGAYLKVSILHEDPEWVPRSLFEAASLCLKAGQKARAARVFKELVKDHPDSPWTPKARKRLAALASSRKQ